MFPVTEAFASEKPHGTAREKKILAFLRPIQ
jgi:hypothetical protein